MGIEYIQDEKSSEPTSSSARELARFQNVAKLLFAAPLEKEFQRTYAKRNLMRVRLACIIGLVLNCCFTVLDFLAIPDQTSWFLLIRHGLITLMLVIALALSLIKGFRYYYQSTIIFVCLSAGLGLVSLATVMGDTPSGYHFPGIMLVIIFIYALSGMLFYYACTTAALITLVYTVMVYLVGLAFWQNVYNVVFLFSTNAICACSCYLYEFYVRKNFLHERRLKEEQSKLKAAGEQLRYMAEHDGLTNLFNRREFDKRFKTAWNDAHREGYPVSLMMIDVDHFKTYNDNYGHQQGDKCLIQIAEALAEVTRRPLDTAARYGGEEFIVLCPRTGLDQASILARKLQRHIEKLHIEHKHSPVSSHVTVSIGLASSIPRDKPCAALLKTADMCLYKAKSAGRNRIVTHLELNISHHTPTSIEASKPNVSSNIDEGMIEGSSALSPLLSSSS